MADMDTYNQEHELQTRNRIVSNHLKDRDNCIVLRIDTQMTTVNEISPFGFHFELDKKKYAIRKKQLRREKITKWLSWLAYYHHKFGIRHIFLVLLLAGYVFLGGWIFQSLESPNEIKDLKQTIVLMQGIIKEMADDCINVTLTYNGTVREDKMGKLIKKYYKTMLEAEGRFHGSVWHKAENLEMHLMWYYSSATFYCMTLFTTIGYGTITCQTFWGRALSVVYACIGIPLMLVVLGDIGEWFQKILTKSYVFLLIKYKYFRGQELHGNKEDIFLPMWIALPLVLGYILSCTLIIKFFDHNEGNQPGIGFSDAFYFTFISLTTIGLGDVMPYNIQYSPLLASAFLLGLALISIVNTSIYAQLYDIFFSAVEKVEAQLDKIHRERWRGHGYRVFQDMEPAFRLLVCSFPNVGTKKRKSMDDNIRNSFRLFKKKKDMAIDIPMRKRTESDFAAHDGNHVPHLLNGGHYQKRRVVLDVGGPMVRTRTESDIAVHDGKHMPEDIIPEPLEEIKQARKRAPTLGAFGGFDLSKFKADRKTARPYFKNITPTGRQAEEAADEEAESRSTEEEFQTDSEFDEHEEEDSDVDQQQKSDDNDDSENEMEKEQRERAAAIKERTFSA